MSTARRIGVFTSTRAEYGLLYPILTALRDAADLDLLLIAAGSHLATSHGSTIIEIERDDIPVSARVVSLLDNDSSVGTSFSLALTLQGVAIALEEHRPDILVVLGDRYEALGAALAATMARIPICHLHGGEATEGVIDEAIRHSITKLSHLHLVAAEPFRQRVIQMGEARMNVQVVGAPGLDNIRNMELLSRERLAEALAWDPGQSYLLVTYHPVTLDPGSADREVRAIVRALERHPERRVLMTAPNADQEGSRVRRPIEELAATDPARFHFASSLGQLRYLSAMKHADAVVGNSSSGLIEAPFLGTPTVNIGERQRGRPRAPSVVDCAPEEDEIAAAIDRAVRLDVDVSSFYGDGHTAPRVVEALRRFPTENALVKRFHDLPIAP